MVSGGVTGENVRPKPVLKENGPISFFLFSPFHQRWAWRMPVSTRSVHTLAVEVIKKKIEALSAMLEHVLGLKNTQNIKGPCH